jgi:sugar lactone lactonase YvrE
MNISSTKARVLDTFNTGEDRYLPEGPRSIVLDGRDAVMWVGIQRSAKEPHGTIHLGFWDTGEVRSLPQLSRPGFAIPTLWPGFAVCGREKEIGLLDLSTNRFEAWAVIPDASPRTIINDGEVAPGGQAVVFGTKDLRFAEPIAQLYLFTVDDRKVSTLAEGQTCSNGKVFARDGNELLLYDIDTPRRNVLRCRIDLAGRRLAEPHVVLDLHNQPGFPDGMIDGGDGSVIIAFYHPDPVPAGRAIRFDLAKGEAIEEWTTPGSPRVTCPLLVERSGRIQLLLTTADEGMPDEMRPKCPDAGRLFIAETTLERFPAVEVVRL